MVIPGTTRDVKSLDRPIRASVVDDHALLCNLLVDRLRREGFEAVGVFGESDTELMDGLAESRPDVVLLDDDLGDRLGHSVRFIAPSIELGALVVMLTSTDDRVLQARCVEEGASGIMHKRIHPSQLVAAVADVVDGKSLLTPAQRAELIVDLRRARTEDRKQRAPFDALTDRERQVLTAICHGDSAAGIAGNWEVSVATVRSHIHAVLLKLGAGSQLEAVAMARRIGFPWSGGKNHSTHMTMARTSK